MRKGRRMIIVGVFLFSIIALGGCGSELNIQQRIDDCAAKGKYPVLYQGSVFCSPVPVCTSSLMSSHLS